MDSSSPFNYESYAQTLSQTMADAVATVEALALEAAADREIGHDDHIAMREILNQLELRALHAAEDERKAVRVQVEAEMADMLTTKLRQRGWLEDKIEVLLPALAR